MWPVESCERIDRSFACYLSRSRLRDKAQAYYTEPAPLVNQAVAVSCLCRGQVKQTRKIESRTPFRTLNVAAVITIYLVSAAWKCHGCSRSVQDVRREAREIVVMRKQSGVEL